MGIQEIIALGAVAGAGVFTLRRFIKQFTDGDEAAGKCAKCELQKAVTSANTAKSRARKS